MRTNAMSSIRILGLALAIGSVTPAAMAATFGELSGGMPSPGFPSYSAGPYAVPPSAGGCPPYCAPVPAPLYGGPEGQLPGGNAMPNVYDLPTMGTNPNPFLPIDSYGRIPHNQLSLWTFGQVNSTTDPFNPWGLSTPYMFVPWSTPMSAWSNAQTWNWWRERSGALPRNW